MKGIEPKARCLDSSFAAGKSVAQKRREGCPNLGHLFSGDRLHYKTMTTGQIKQALNRSCE
jgi:hypothetical protein